MEERRLSEEELLRKEQELEKKEKELKKKESMICKAEEKILHTKFDIYSRIDVSLATMDKIIAVSVVLIIIAIIAGVLV